MSEFNTPVSCEQVSPSRIAPADAVKNGVAYLLAGLGVFGIVEGAQLIVGFVWGVGFAALWAVGFFTGDVEAVFDASLVYALALASPKGRRARCRQVRSRQASCHSGQTTRRENSSIRPRHAISSEIGAPTATTKSEMALSSLVAPSFIISS